MAEEKKLSKAEALKKKIEEYEKQLKNLEAKENEKAKKLDLQRKFIVDEAMIGFFKKDTAFANDLRGILKEFVTKPRDIEVIADLINDPSEQPAIAKSTDLTRDSSTTKQTTVADSQAVQSDS